MRYRGGHGARLRRRLLAGAALVLAAAVGAAVTLPLLRDRSQRRLDRRADREVTATAQRTRAMLLATRPAQEAALRDVADAMDGVEVLAVEAGDAGVRLVFRVRVAKTAASVFGWQQATATGCFAQVVGRTASPAALERLPCPEATRSPERPASPAAGSGQERP